MGKNREWRGGNPKFSTFLNILNKALSSRLHGVMEITTAFLSSPSVG